MAEHAKDADSVNVDAPFDIRQRPGFFVFSAVALAVFAVIAALGFVLPAVAFDAGEEQAARLAVLAIGIGSTALFGYFAVFAAIRARWGRAVVMRLAPEGLWHRVSTSGQTIGWGQISRIRLQGGKGGGLKLTVDPDVFRAVLPGGLQRLLYRINWAHTGHVLSIHVGGLELSPRRIADLTQTYASAHGGPRTY